MKCVVHLDMDLTPKLFDSFDEAVDFVESNMKDTDLTVQWRRDDEYPDNYSGYTRQQLAEEFAKTGEVCLQLVGGTGEDIIIGPIANIVTEEMEKKDVAEATAELDKIGQEMANSYNTTISIGWEGKTFKPGKAKPAKKLTRKRKKHE